MSSKYNHEKDVFKQFESVTEYADFLRGNVPSRLIENSRDYFAGSGFNNALELLVNGDTAHIERAQSIVSEMQEEGLFSSGVPILKSAVQGYIPIVARAIQGHPEAFFTRSHDETHGLNTPLSVYVETSLSAGVNETSVINRGVAIIAFVMAMGAIRPVNLYAAYAGVIDKNYGFAVNLGSTPINMQVATWALTNISFPRRLGFHAMMACSKKQYGSVPWCWNMQPTNQDYIDSMKDAFHMQQEDIFIPGGHLYDKLMLTNPVQWVKNMIAKHRGDTTLEG